MNFEINSEIGRGHRGPNPSEKEDNPSELVEVGDLPSTPSRSTFVTDLTPHKKVGRCQTRSSQGRVHRAERR
jgi:hypothetical protein